MPLSTDITLPKEVKPRFPDKCIVTGNSPDSTIRITQNSANWFLSFFMPILMLFGFSKVEIPICEECKIKFRLQRWGRVSLVDTSNNSYLDYKPTFFNVA